MLGRTVGQTSTVPNKDEATPITTVLLDLDGVIRHFDAAHVARVEAEAGLEPGSLEAAAFSDGLIEPLVTGRISRVEWTREVGLAVGDLDAATTWLAAKGEVDGRMIELIDELRLDGITVAILTNGTDTIPAELDELDVSRHVDAVFNSAEIGVAKPDPMAFEHVCTALGVDGTEVFFTDDSVAKMAGAAAIGMTVHHFVDVDDLRRRLHALGLSKPR